MEHLLLGAEQASVNWQQLQRHSKDCRGGKGWEKETAHNRGFTGIVANSESKLTLYRRGAECQVAGLFSASGCSGVLLLFLHHIL